jgi:hypothetical protein
MFSNLFSITLPNIKKYFPGIHFKKKLIFSKQMNRKLSKKAYMNGLEKSSTVVIMQAKNIKTLNITCVCEKKATKKKKIE